MNNALTKHAVKVGVYAVLLFVLCLIWRVTMSDPAVEEWHLLALKTALPGFNGYDALSVLLGGAESFVYGFLAAVVFHKVHGDCCVSKN